MTKEKKHSKHYYEEGRNGWTPTSTVDKLKENKDSSDILEYAKKLEDYVVDMENYLLNNGGLENKDRTFSVILDGVVKDVTDLLKSKNKAYGNTALNPPKIFSKLSSTEAICARLDDKLSRIQNKGINDATEDTIDDIIGYLLLLKMSMIK
tara:strand:+ start:1229 stop:1681 length:453 start_codon:yes stop_codon:yes gene_type:complete